MKISLNWLRDFVDLGKHSGEDLQRLLTLHTAEVEACENLGEKYTNVVIGEIQKVWRHPNSDRLNLTLVNLGGKTPSQIVCGGQNLKENMLVAVALPGAVVNVHGEELFEIQTTKIRGEESNGMICAGEEIWLEPDNLPGAKGDVKIKDLSWTKAKPGTSLADVLHQTDLVLDIDNKSLTHRPDLWGHYGIAREVAALIQKPLKPLEPLLKFKKGKPSAKLSIEIQDPQICSRFSAAVLTGIAVKESPDWMKARLQAAGMNAHNTIVDITNYVMLELGHPMHAYDRTVLEDDAFIIREAKKGETLLTLEGAEHRLNAGDPLVCDGKNRPVGIAGIKGGLRSGISEKTTEIVLEAGHFDSIAVRKASQSMGLRTDASQRFEKNLDPSNTERALARAIALIQELCPEATLISEIETVGSWKAKPLTLSLNADLARKKIGVDVPTKKMISILESLEFEVKAKGEQLSVTVPSHRATGDVDIEEDLVEEIARIYGYSEIPAVLPELPISLPAENKERRSEHEARRILAYRLGFTELMNYSFYGRKEMEAALLPEEGHIHVLNYLSEDQTHMRRSLLPNLLNKVVKNGADREQMKLFEIGHTYEDVGNYMPREEAWLIAAVAQEKDPFYEAKGALEAFFAAFQMGSLQLKPAQTAPSYAHPKKCVSLMHRGKVLGHLFTVHPAVKKAFGLNHEVAAFEFKLQELVANGNSMPVFKTPPRFPGMSFDISVLVPKRSEVAELEKALRKADPAGLIENISLFDIYEGKNIPADQKSLSFSIVLRREDRTLTEVEFQELQKAAFLALEQKGGIIRGKL